MRITTVVVAAFPLAPDQGLLRRRTTRLTAGLLGSIEAGMMPALTLNLFQDVVFTAVFERMEETYPGLVWVGRARRRAAEPGHAGRRRGCALGPRQSSGGVVRHPRRCGRQGRREPRSTLRHNGKPHRFRCGGSEATWQLRRPS